MHIIGRGERAAALRLVEAVSVAQKWRTLDPVVRKGRRAIGKVFVAQGRGFAKSLGELSWVTESRRSFTPPQPSLREGWGVRESFIPDDAWMSRWDAVARATLGMMLAAVTELNETGLTLGAGSMAGQLGIDGAFSLRNPRAVAYLADHGAALVTRINQTTMERMRVVLVEAMDEGYSYTAVARRIREEFSGMAGLKPQAHIRDRAELIAVTEAGNAFERAQSIVVRDLVDAGVAMEKSWLTVGDDRVSPGCAANEDEGWIPAGQAFSSGHQEPLRFPGCRCTAQYRMVR